MLIDSHCHLASECFQAPQELHRVLQNAEEANISRIITLSTSTEDIDATLAANKSHPSVFACLGIHPCEVTNVADNALSKIESLLGENKICGLGETGLDYFHPAPDGWSGEKYRSRQREFLDGHFSLAKKYSFPVVIHTRDREGDASFRDALEIYKTYADHVRAVFHCFIYSLEQAQEVISLGGLVSFGGILTFRNAGQVRDVAAALVPGTFMLETDSPYLAPHPHRGKRNEPAFVYDTAVALAAARNESLAELAEHTTKTAIDFFKNLA